MKILFLTNNDITQPLSNWLSKEAGEEVILFEKRLTKEYILDEKPDFTVSYNYKYIIREEVIALLEPKIINLHISYLPWNKGASPSIWSFLKNTPKGVTIHQLDAGLDTGKILVQKELIFAEENETLMSAYDKLHVAIQELFKDNWEDIKSLSIEGKTQTGSGSIQRIMDFKEIQDILGDEGWRIPIPLLKERYQKLNKNQPPSPSNQPL